MKEETNPILLGLNKEQKAAVTTFKGPVLIIAGAGTGKTTVIARRIAYLIEQKLAQPKEILALTFTDKAANEMEDRVDQLMPYGTFDTTIATFHGFGEQILRAHALELGLSTDFKILSKPQQVLFIQQNLFRFDLHHYRPLATPTKFIQALIALFSRAKDETITPEEYREFIEQLSSSVIASVTRQPRKVSDKSSKEDSRRRKNDEEWDPLELEKQQELAKVYAQYEQFKTEAGVLDFGDLILKVKELFDRYPAVLEKYQDRFKYILVDEYQDTNYAQNEVVKMLASKHKNICVVGDDDQSIYRFRGAAISNILAFEETYPKSKKIVLTTNYRSTQPILDAAYQLIQFNNPDRLEAKNNISKKLQSAKSATGFEIQTLYKGTVAEEVDAVIDEIERLTGKGLGSRDQGLGKDKELNPKPQPLNPAVTYNDIAILVRANNHAEPFLQSLAIKGIPYKFTGSSGLYDTQEIRELISFLSVIANFNDSLSFYTFMTSSFYDVPMIDLIKLTDLAKKKSRPLYWAVEKATSFADTLELTNEGVKQLEQIVADIAAYTILSKKENAGKVLYQFLQAKGVFSRLGGEESTLNATKIANIAKFFDKINEFNKLTNNESPQAFIEYLTTLRDAGDDPGTATIEMEYDGVNVMTVHSAKGLEFKVVFIVNVVSDRFPSRERAETIPLPDALIKETLPEGDFHIQEERRLFYVAITRASDLLYLTWAQDYGGKRLKKISPFVAEAIGLANIPTDIFAPTTTKKLEQLNLFWSSLPPLNQKPTNQITLLAEDEQLLSINQSQVEEYLTCPTRYEYSTLLKIPLARSHLFVYGSAIHSAIQEFYKAKMNHKVLPLAEMLACFEHAWVDEGFLSQEHELQRFEQGKLAVKAFWEREKDNPKIPTWIEKQFKLTLLDNIKLIGRFDRVDFNGNKAHIIDFKTTEGMDETKAKKRAKESKQLAIYALGFYKMFNTLPEKLSLYFVDNGVMGSYEPTMDTIKKAEDAINQAAAGIRAGDFSPNPTLINCTFCAYNSICPYAVVK